jgi:transposase
MFRIERCDDLPLLGQLIKSSNIASIYTKHYPDHGHWQGIDGGHTIMVWLLYILSEADHRLSHVEDWCKDRLETIRAIIGQQQLRGLDLCDDRLGRLLDRLGDDEKWMAFECDFSGQMVQSYSLDKVCSDEPCSGLIRLDSFNIPQHREEDDFFRRGHTKQRRTDRPFCKAMVASSDFGNFPLTIQLLAGNISDDTVYLPAIERVKRILGSQSRLYVADSKIGSFANRLALASSENYYLCPLNGKQCTQKQLVQYIDAVPAIDQLPVIAKAKGSHQTNTYYYELPSGFSLSCPQSNFSWDERRVLAYSTRYAADYDKGLFKRLNKAEKELNNLLIRKSGRKVPKTEDELKVRVAKILQKHHVKGFFHLEYSQVESYRTVNKYRKRKARIEKSIELSLQVQRDQQAIEQQRKRHGWCIYGTNLPKSVDTRRIVQLYHEQYKIEHLFDRFINQGTKLLPVFLNKHDRVKALTRLLAIAIQFHMLVQHLVRLSLEEEQKQIKGGYPGNKNRATNLPTTSMILRMFKNVSVLIQQIDGKRTVQMPPLNQLQLDLLRMLGMQGLYLEFCSILESG